MGERDYPNNFLKKALAFIYKFYFAPPFTKHTFIQNEFSFFPDFCSGVTRKHTFEKLFEKFRRRNGNLYF